MSWNGNFTSFPSTTTSIYETDFNPFPEVKNFIHGVEMPSPGSNTNNNNMSQNNQERKRRLTDEQIDSLERSFEEEIKLEPERKMRLSKELGLQPRQVAVWFQNRRARWKVKQIERLYDALKKEFDVVIRDNLRLQDEVMKLKAKLEDRASTKQGSTGYTDVSAEETVESKSVVFRSFNNNRLQSMNTCQQIHDCTYLFNVDDYSPSSLPYWGVLPSAYP